jgi:type I restriction enzyme R subunit
LSKLDVAELSQHVSDLIRYEDQDEYAKRFDVLIHNLETVLVCGEGGEERLMDAVTEIASGLELKRNIPAVQEHLDLLRQIKSGDFWKTASVATLEETREKIRNLVRLLDRDESGGKVITHFEDVIDGVAVEREIVGGFSTFVNYRARAEKLIRELESSSDTTIYRLKHNRPISDTDMKHLEDILFSQAGTREEYEKEVGNIPLGVFIRSIVGLDRAAAKEAFSDFLSTGNFSGDQIRFIESIIDHLTQNGILKPDVLYDAPFTDLHDQGLEGLFDKDKVRSILSVVQKIADNANAA